MSGASKWDEGCENDDVRNQFVIPRLIKLVNEIRPKHVLDIGAGTGYIVRTVDAGVNTDVKWTLVDMDQERIAFLMNTMPKTVSFEAFANNFIQDDLGLHKFDCVLLLFTLLELNLDMELFSKIRGLTNQNGIVVITMPDSLEDVLKAAAQEPSLLTDFVNGKCIIPKVDKFTNEEYPFKAHRFEYIIQLMLYSNFTLIKMFSHNQSDKETFMLVFRKNGGIS